MAVRNELWNLTVTCAPAFAAVVEELLAEESLAVTILSPPRDITARVEVLFSAPPDEGSLHARLALLAKVHKTKTPAFFLERVGNLDWLKKVASDFPPLKIARWTVFGAAHKKAVQNVKYKLQIDATIA